MERLTKFWEIQTWNEGGDAPKEADQEAYPPEQIPLLDYPESRPCTFNHEVGIDVFEIIDSVGKRSLTVDVVCKRVAYVQVMVERKSERSSPSFHTSLQAYDFYIQDRTDSRILENPPFRSSLPLVSRHGVFSA